MWETQVQSLGEEDPLEKEMATHSSILAWKSHGRRSLAGYSPWGRRVGHDCATHSLTHSQDCYCLDPYHILLPDYITFSYSLGMGAQFLRHQSTVLPFAWQSNKDSLSFSSITLSLYFCLALGAESQDSGNNFGAQENKICQCFHFSPFYTLWNDGSI